MRNCFHPLPQISTKQCWSCGSVIITDSTSICNKYLSHNPIIEPLIKTYRKRSTQRCESKNATKEGGIPSNRSSIKIFFSSLMVDTTWSWNNHWQKCGSLKALNLLLHCWKTWDLSLPIPLLEPLSFQNKTQNLVCFIFFGFPNREWIKNNNKKKVPELERCSWNSGWTRAPFPETISDSKPSEVGQVVFLGTSGIGWSMVSSWPMSRISSIIEARWSISVPQLEVGKRGTEEDPQLYVALGLGNWKITISYGFMFSVLGLCFLGFFARGCVFSFAVECLNSV